MAALSQRRAILAIDTSTLQAGVALVGADGEVIGSRRDRVTTHSERLLPLIAELLAEAGLAAADLEAVACGAGPGSFTGLRIGLATAKGLCLATGRPLLMVSSLAALAARVPAGPAGAPAEALPGVLPGALIVPCIDAFKGEVYAGFYAPAPPAPAPAVTTWPGPPVALAPEAVLAPGRLRERLLEHLARGGAVHLVGDGPIRWPALDVPGVDASDGAPPDPVEVGRLALARRRRVEAGVDPGPGFDDLAAAVPTYIRPSEAEIHGPPPALAPLTRPPAE